MAEVKLNNLLRLYRLRSKFDAVILAVHACLVERGFRCINSGEERNAQQECDFGETLPPDWNSLDDVYALQYRRGNLSSVFIFKALKLGDKLMLYLMEEDESKMHDTNLDVDRFTSTAVDYSSVQPGSQQIDRIFRELDRLKTKIFRDVVDKFTSGASRAGSQEERMGSRADNQSSFQFSFHTGSAGKSPIDYSTTLQNEGCLRISENNYYTLNFSDWPKAYSGFLKSVRVTSSSCRSYNNHIKDTQGHREQPSRLIDDDPLRIPPRRPPDFHGEWAPPVGPFGYGDGDRLPGHPGTSGGMLMDPFRSGGMGSTGGQGFGPPPHPGQLPRGAVPPGARFDPFGPVPPGGSRADPRSGRFAGPDPDHLPPPGYDDMFM